MPVNFDPSAFSAAMRRAVMAGVIQATEVVRTEAIRLVLETKKSGQQYGRHKASAPGEPWASNTGYALSQIKTSYDAAELTGRVTINADYGLFLELGTVKMEPRPVLRPALANKATQVQRIIDEAVARALRLGGRS